MRGTSRLICGICLLGWAAGTPAWAERGLPRPISPGSADGFTAVTSVCPTFSWTDVEGAEGYELQLFTDGTAIIGDLREFRILPSSSPPIVCTSFLQEGMLYWDSDIGALCACDGSSWEPVDSDNMGSCS